MTEIDQERLRDEIRWLGEELGHVIREQAGEDAFDLVEEVRALARARREGGEGAEDRLVARLESLEPGAAEPLIGALSVFFDLANLAEDRQRVRVVRARERAGSPAAGRGEGTLSDAVRRLREQGLGPEAVQALLDDTGVEFVFTAHPTEAKRRSVREKVRDLRGHLYDLDDPGLLPREVRVLEERVRADLTGLWMTDFVRFRRPSVLEELDRSLFFAGNLWAAVPRLFRELGVALEAAYPGHEFRIPPLVRFGTWIGGDRDGNPYVTAEVTRASLARLREEALTRHVEQARLTRRSLSMSLRKAGASPSLLGAIEEAVDASPALAEALSHLSNDEPYRRWLAIVEARLRGALEGRGEEVGEAEAGAAGEARPAGEAYGDPRELVRDLQLMRESLVANGGSILADAHVDDWICQAEVFGFSLMRLDVRQDSGRYNDDLGEILAHLGIHEGYSELDEEDRQRVLSESMPCRAPVSPQALSDDARETVALFELLAGVCRRSGPGSLGAHVISMTRRPSDVLAVLWLSRWAAAREGLSGDRLPVPIAPLFETIDDLASAATTLDRLLSHPAWRKEVDALGGRQMVMVGYSDSTKDGGYLAAAWKLFDAQSRMQDAAEAHGVPLVFFHGRGGALGRGGGPAARHIRSLPPATLRAGLRITEQGEVLAERYDDRRVAGRHLQQMLSAVLEGGGRALLPDSGVAGAGGDGAPTVARAEPELPRALFESLARTSREAYRALVDHPGFLRYFEEATPIQGIEDLPIGSRPARRGGQRSLTSLRAIPWVFSWTQSRHMLPAWYGLGSAVEAAGPDLETLRDLYRTSSFFRATIDNAELALAKADMGIARIHGRLVEDAGVRREIGRMIEAEFERSQAAVLALTGQAELLDQVPWLKRSISVRNPYVDPLNLLQVALFRRLRSAPEGSEDESEARELIRLTIQGIAGGLRTTG